MHVQDKAWIMNDLGMNHFWVPRIESLDGPLYRLIADNIESDICSGALTPGTVLPPQRELADILGVGITTITRAYKEAARKGLIKGDRRCGTVVGPFDKHYSLLAEIESRQKDDYTNVIQPHGSKPASLRKILAGMAKDPRTDHLLSFPAILKTDVMVRAGAAWLARFGMNVDSDELLICPGAHNGIVAALAAVAAPGDYIITESFTYMGIAGIADFLRLRLLPCEMDDEGILPDAFQSLCSRRPVKALYCIPTVHNPTNAHMTLARRQDIIAVAERYGVSVIEDDMLTPIIENPTPLLKHLAPHRCFLVTSPSMILCPGLKVGVVVPPSGSLKITMDNLWAMMVRIPPLLIEIFKRIVDGPQTQSTIDQVRIEARRRQSLAGKILPSEYARCHPASYQVWISLPDYWSSDSFSREAMSRGVQVWPGEMCAVQSAPPQDTKAVRYLIGMARNRSQLKLELELIASLLDMERCAR